MSSYIINPSKELTLSSAQSVSGTGSITVDQLKDIYTYTSTGTGPNTYVQGTGPYPGTGSTLYTYTPDDPTFSQPYTFPPAGPVKSVGRSKLTKSHDCSGPLSDLVNGL